MADYAVRSVVNGGDGTVAAPPSWHEPGTERSHSLFVLSNTDGSVLAQFPGSGQLMPKLVTPHGIIAQEDLGGPISCFPATITPRENAH